MVKFSLHARKRFFIIAKFEFINRKEHDIIFFFPKEVLEYLHDNAV